VVLSADQPPYVAQPIDFQHFYPPLYLNSYHKTDTTTLREDTQEEI
jgi:hypothetical protein